MLPAQIFGQVGTYLHQVFGHLDLCAVKEALSGLEGGRVLGDALEERVHCQRIVIERSRTHVRDAVLGLIQCDGRGGQQARLQLGQRVGLLLVRPDGVLGQKDQDPGKRQEEDGYNHVEQRVEVRNTCLVNGLAPKTEADRVLHGINHDKENDRADEVKVEMHHRRPTGVFAAADRGQEGRDAGADILAENNRDRRRIGNSTGG